MLRLLRVKFHLKTCSCPCTFECLTGDIFKSLRCDCNKQLDIALEKIGEGRGFSVYAPGNTGNRTY